MEGAMRFSGSLSDADKTGYVLSPASKLVKVLPMSPNAEVQRPRAGV